MKETKETYQCMDAKCGHTFQTPTRLPAHPTMVRQTRGAACNKCGSIFVRWVNFETDWIYVSDSQGWKRKDYTEEEWAQM